LLTRRRNIVGQSGKMCTKQYESYVDVVAVPVICAAGLRPESYISGFVKSF
jgi:hypothetical protein